ncbi:MAG: hypothetical protein JKX85_08535 [Phycisphaeraceae bacterium]|nr:hypothetical protein [Phycisphaeraceae bacterium]
MKGKAVYILVLVIVLAVGASAWLTRDQQAFKPQADMPVAHQVFTNEQAHKLVIMPATIQINRDYNQRGSVQIRNDNDKPVTLRVMCQSPDDLTCVLFNSNEAVLKNTEPQRLAAGLTQKLTLLIHANRAKKRVHRIPIVAQVLDSNGQWQIAAHTFVTVKIALAPLQLKAQWIEPHTSFDKARLSKTLRITNQGLDIPDFSITYTQQVDTQGNILMNQGALHGKVHLNPIMQRAVFLSHSSIDIDVSPMLTPQFLELGGSLYLHGQGQYIQVPYFATVALKQNIYPTHNTQTTVAHSRGDFCLAKPMTSYVFPLVTKPNRTVEHQADENATHAWVLVELQSQMMWTQDKPVTMTVYFNDQSLGQITRRLLAGRFLFEVPFKQLHGNQVAGLSPQFNSVRLEFQATDQNVSQFSSSVSLYIKHDYQQQYLVAPSDKAAKQLTVNVASELPTNKSGLWVIENRWELPESVNAGDQLDAVFELFNTRESSSAAGKLMARIGDKIVGQANFDVLKPFEKRQVKIQLSIPKGISKDAPVKLAVNVNEVEDVKQ